MNIIKNKNSQIDPKIIDILDLLVKGVFLSSLFLFPAAGVGIASIYSLYAKYKDKKDYKEWEKYKRSKLRFNLQRLKQQKYIKIINKDTIPEIQLTDKGKKRLFEYKINSLTIEKQKTWDNKWRIIIYDISQFKRYQQDKFRRFIKKLNMFQLQKSVYITPYPCEKEINILRQYFNLNDEVTYLTSDYIENDIKIRRYFQLYIKQTGIKKYHKQS